MSKKKKRKSTEPKIERFYWYGFHPQKESEDELIGNCIFCKDPKHFYLNQKTLLWNCKKCGVNGNEHTFLGQVIDLYYKKTRARDYERLSENRGIPIETLREARLCRRGKIWLIPYFSHKAKLSGHKRPITDIKNWTPGRDAISTKGCKTGLFNSNHLLYTEVGSTVWVCEGAWDALALGALLEGLGISDIVVAVPGAEIFKNDWIDWFEDMNVILCYDNDPAGDRGLERAAEKLKNIATVNYIEWPDEKIKPQPKRDVRGLINHLKKKLVWKEKKILKTLKALTKLLHSQHELQKPMEVQSTPTFEEVVEEYKKYIRMTPDLIDALALIFAVALTTKNYNLLYNPLWLFLVGTPSSAKTELIKSLKKALRMIYQSSISPHALISGYKEKEGKDWSLLPDLNGGCLLWKDYTEIMGMRVEDRASVLSTLRGAYDGTYVKRFGHVERKGTSRFATVAGVTNIIHSDKQSSVGDRFLKFQIAKVKEQEVIKDTIKTALVNVTREREMEDTLQQIAYDFMEQERDISKLPELADWEVKRIIGLSQIVAELRANVEWEKFKPGKLQYRPGSEEPYRLAKQFGKLAQMLTIVKGKKRVTPDVMRIVEHVAVDTCIGFNIEIVQAMIELGGKTTVQAVQQRTQLPTQNVRDALQDLWQLRIVKKLKDKGPETEDSYGRFHSTDLYILSPKMRRLWKNAGIKRSHIERIVKNRRQRHQRTKAEME